MEMIEQIISKCYFETAHFYKLGFIFLFYFIPFNNECFYILYFKECAFVLLQCACCYLFKVVFYKTPSEIIVLMLHGLYIKQFDTYILYKCGSSG